MLLTGLVRGREWPCAGTHLALLPKHDLIAVLCAQIPHSHIAILAAGHQTVGALDECLHCSQTSAEYRASGRYRYCTRIVRCADAQHSPSDKPKADQDPCTHVQWQAVPAGLRKAGTLAGQTTWHLL